MSNITRVLTADQWAASDGFVDDAPFIIRFRTPVLRAGEVDGYEHRLSIVWPYADEDSGAMPSDDDSEAMRQFEDRLCMALEHDAHAMLAAVLTFDGARQWVFYAKDIPECGHRINTMPQNDDRYPIELTCDHDPDWTYLHDQILRRVNWQDHQEEWRSILPDRSEPNNEA